MEDILVHMHQCQTTRKQLKYKGETTTAMVLVVNINDTTTLCISKVEERRQATLEDHDIRYIKSILSGLDKTPVDTKELINKGYIKHFHKEILYLDNWFIF